MKAALVNNKEKSIELNEKVWNVDFNEDLVAQAVNIFLSNQRKGSANVKKRGEVSGGGKKPWKQKGTGRARQGSIRSPLWVKGGVTFGPSTDRSWSRKFSKRMNRQAIVCALSEMLRKNALQFVSVDLDAKLKEMRNDFLKYANEKKSTMLITKSGEFGLAVRNLENVEYARPETLNVYDVVKCQNVFVEQDAVKILEEKLLNE